MEHKKHKDFHRQVIKGCGVQTECHLRQAEDGNWLKIARANTHLSSVFMGNHRFFTLASTRRSSISHGDTTTSPFNGQSVRNNIVVAYDEPGNAGAIVEADQQNKAIEQRIEAMSGGKIDLPWPWNESHCGPEINESLCEPPQSGIPASKTFDIPNPTDWGSSCHLAGGQCPQGLTELYNCPVPETESSYSCEPCRSESNRDILEDVENNCSYSMEQAIRDAWCLLAENIDIVEWVLCMNVGGGKESSCVVETIKTGKDGLLNLDIRIGCTDDEGDCARNSTEEAGGFTTDKWLFRSLIFLCSNNSLFKGWDRIFCCSTDPRVRLCITLQIAEILLHEICHICGFEDNDEPDNCNCNYLIGSTFMWAILQRFPAALDTDCCGWAFSDRDYNEVEDVAELAGVDVIKRYLNRRRRGWYMVNNSLFMDDTGANMTNDYCDIEEGEC